MYQTTPSFCLEFNSDLLCFGLVAPTAVEWYPGVVQDLGTISTATPDPALGRSVGLREQARAIASALEASGPDEVCQLVLSTGASVVVPPQLKQHIARAAEILATGTEAQVSAKPVLLTTSKAAASLAVSRQYLSRLLDQGELPFTRVGTHRRIDVCDIEAYRERRRERRMVALGELVAISEDIGLYSM